MVVKIRSWVFYLIFSLGLILSSSAQDDVDQCRDVSYFGEVQYKEEDCMMCDTEFHTVCFRKQLEVCSEVPNMVCTLVPYTDCKQSTSTLKYNVTEVALDNPYIPSTCINETKLELQVKIVPKCINVTRQDCVTKWELNVRGEKVWTGNEFCSPVTWENCSLVEELHPINHTYTICQPDPAKKVQLTQCKLAERNKIANVFKCEVKHNVECNCSQKSQCVTLTYKECEEVAKPIKCEKKKILVPFQPKIHRVKCLLSDNHETPNIPSNVERPIVEGKVEDISNK